MVITNHFFSLAHHREHKWFTIVVAVSTNTEVALVGVLVSLETSS